MKLPDSVGNLGGKTTDLNSKYRRTTKPRASHLSSPSIPCFTLSFHLLTSSSVMNKSQSAQNAKAMEHNVPFSKRTPSKGRLQHQRQQQQSNPKQQRQNQYHHLQTEIHQPTRPTSQTAPPQAQATQPTTSPHTRKKPSNSACSTSSSCIPG